MFFSILAELVLINEPWKTCEIAWMVPFWEHFPHSFSWEFPTFLPNCLLQESFSFLLAPGFARVISCESIFLQCIFRLVLSKGLCFIFSIGGEVDVSDISPLIKAPFFENGCMPSFFFFVCFILFYFFCPDTISGIDERKLAAALFWGVFKGLVGTYKPFFAYWLNSISDAFQLNCTLFSKHGLTIILDSLSICLSHFLLRSRLT